MSNRYGADSRYVLAGGGNTSYKEGDCLYIKGSGTSLATIKPEEFVVMRRAQVTEILSKTYPEGDQEREAAALAEGSGEPQAPGDGGGEGPGER